MTIENNPVQDEKEKSIPIWVFILAGIAILFVVPSAFAGLMSSDFFSFAPGGTDGWLSYWGAYLGGIIGMIAVVATTQYIVSNQNKQQKEQMEEQRKQHLELLESQNAHHKEQLEEQRKAIINSAELQDKKERERFILQVEIKQIEEFSLLLAELYDYFLKYKLNAFKVIDFLFKSTKAYYVFLEDKENKDNKKTTVLLNSYSELADLLNNALTRNSEIIMGINNILNKFSVFYNFEQNDINELKKILQKNSESVYNKIREKVDFKNQILNSNESFQAKKKKVLCFLEEEKLIIEENDMKLDEIIDQITKVSEGFKTLKYNSINKYKIAD
ncbi:hypothetical protein [Lysinibacillus tabacifolii]|uniref:Uncharacterized protein n=1 Tax=Lysinibacillus tabacifolii TaxID=1173107 RepID=A0ABY2T3K1_9BACI|nr:hypothetical protein [Lysinibacillus tabacifolii]TKI50581.1 hypothetical protein FC748_05050 [Lysinibacillus tabacifolii]